MPVTPSVPPTVALPVTLSVPPTVALPVTPSVPPTVALPVTLSVPPTVALPVTLSVFPLPITTLFPLTEINAVFRTELSKTLVTSGKEESMVSFVKNLFQI